MAKRIKFDATTACRLMMNVEWRARESESATHGPGSGLPFQGARNLAIVGPRALPSATLATAFQADTRAPTQAEGLNQSSLGQRPQTKPKVRREDGVKESDCRDDEIGRPFQGEDRVARLVRGRCPRLRWSQPFRLTRSEGNALRPMSKSMISRCKRMPNSGSVQPNATIFTCSEYAYRVLDERTAAVAQTGYSTTRLGVYGDRVEKSRMPSGDCWRCGGSRPCSL